MVSLSTASSMLALVYILELVAHRAAFSETRYIKLPFVLDHEAVRKMMLSEFSV